MMLGRWSARIRDILGELTVVAQLLFIQNCTLILVGGIGDPDTADAEAIGL